VFASDGSDCKASFCVGTHALALVRRTSDHFLA
jgi:hypothetical protein